MLTLPQLTLQPIVENALTHGFAGRTNPREVRTLGETEGGEHLGLINTYLRLLHASKGAIRMQLHNDCGAVITLTMPIKEIKSMYQVLIVDDEMPALRYLTAIVEKYAPGFAIAQSCVSGEGVLSYLREHRVNLLLTNISMPSMDGITLALKARELYSDIYIIIVTGYADFEYAKRAIHASVDDYILKPVSVSQMREAIEKLRLTLDEEQSARLPQTLSALFSRQPYDEALRPRFFPAVSPVYLHGQSALLHAIIPPQKGGPTP